MAKYHGKYQKASKSRIFLWIGIGCVIVALVFAFFVGDFLYGAVKAEGDRRQAIENYVIPAAAEPQAQTAGEQPPETPAGAETTEAPRETTEETTVPTEPPRFPTIDFESLRRDSESVVAWIQIPALEIVNYPVAQGEDNAFFVTHSWNGAESENGAVFLDFRNQGDFSQVHNILYRHSKKDGSMFQALGQWESEAFYESNDRTVLLYLPGETRVYEIFAVERVDALNNRVYKTDYAADESWAEALRETLQKSQRETQRELTAGSEVLTLSTCMGDMDRLVVHAVCIERVPV